MTIAARDVVVTDVHLMSRGLAHFAPRCRHVVGTAALAWVRARGNRSERDDARQCAQRHREPTGWQSLQGIADIGSWLDQPGGCGLPPTPPTR